MESTSVSKEDAIRIATSHLLSRGAETPPEMLDIDYMKKFYVPGLGKQSGWCLTFAIPWKLDPSDFSVYVIDPSGEVYIPPAY